MPSTLKFSLHDLLSPFCSHQGSLKRINHQQITTLPSSGGLFTRKLLGGKLIDIGVSLFRQLFPLLLIILHISPNLYSRNHPMLVPIMGISLLLTNGNCKRSSGRKRRFQRSHPFIRQMDNPMMKVGEGMILDP